MTTLGGGSVGKGSPTWQDSKAQVVFGLASASDEHWKGENLFHSLSLCFVLATS